MTVEPIEPRNAVFGVPRYTPLQSCSGGVGCWEDDYPVEALAYDEPAYVARTVDTDPLNTWFVVTLPERLPVRLIGLVGHNLSTTAKFRLRLYSTLADLADDVAVYELQDDVFPTDEEFGTRRWESRNWWNGKPLQEDIEGYRWTRPIWLPEVFRIAAYRVDLIDTNNPDGYLQIGVADTSWGWQVPENYDWGGSFGLKINTAVEATDAGPLFDEKPSKQQRRVRFSGFPRGPAITRALKLLRKQDIVRPVLFLPDPGAPHEWVQQVLYARVTPQSSFVEEQGNTINFDWLLEEV